MNKKNTIIITSIVVLIVIIIGIIFINNNLNNKDNKQINVITKKLKKIGELYYTNYYYQNAEDFIKSKAFDENGITISITNLEAYNNATTDTEFKKYFNDEFIKIVNDNNCNSDKSVVTIFPKDPYSVKNYNVEVSLICK